jgi:hypothetical protein
MTSSSDISSLVGALPEGTIPPKYAPLLQLLGSMLKDEQDDDDPAGPGTSREVARLRSRLEAQTRRLAQAHRMIRAYRDQNRLLARAHGACECWGGNQACPHCGGRGSARWAAPDRDLLRDLLGEGSGPERPPSPSRKPSTNQNPKERGR